MIYVTIEYLDVLNPQNNVDTTWTYFKCFLLPSIDWRPGSLLSVLYWYWCDVSIKL